MSDNSYKNLPPIHTYHGARNNLTIFFKDDKIMEIKIDEESGTRIMEVRLLDKGYSVLFAVVSRDINGEFGFLLGKANSGREFKCPITTQMAPYFRAVQGLVFLPYFAAKQLLEPPFERLVQRMEEGLALGCKE